METSKLNVVVAGLVDGFESLFFSFFLLIFFFFQLQQQLPSCAFKVWSGGDESDGNVILSCQSLGEMHKGSDMSLYRKRENNHMWCCSSPWFPLHLLFFFHHHHHLVVVLWSSKRSSFRHQHHLSSAKESLKYFNHRGSSQKLEHFTLVAPFVPVVPSVFSFISSNPVPVFRLTLTLNLSVSLKPVP